MSLITLKSCVGASEGSPTLPTLFFRYPRLPRLPLPWKQARSFFYSYKMIKVILMQNRLRPEFTDPQTYCNRTATGPVQAGTRWTKRYRKVPENRINKPDCRTCKDGLDLSGLTQNPVVRKHRVGSSPTSGTTCSEAFRFFYYLLERRRCTQATIGHHAEGRSGARWSLLERVWALGSIGQSERPRGMFRGLSSFLPSALDYGVWRSQVVWSISPGESA